MRDERDLVAARPRPFAELERQQRVRGLIGRQVRRDVDDAHNVDVGCRMVDGGWWMVDGGWRMADGGMGCPMRRHPSNVIPLSRDEPAPEFHERDGRRAQLADRELEEPLE